jgi:hypothetical protein
MPFRRNCIPRKLRYIKLVLNHDGLSYVIHDLVVVDEFRALLQMEDSWQN